MNSIIKHPAIDKIIASEKNIDNINQYLANLLNKRFYNSNKRPIFVPILKGAIFFATDLLRKLTFNLDVDFIQVSSYVNTRSTGNIKVINDISSDLSNKDVVILDEIVDTGKTMDWVKKYFKNKGAKNILMVSLMKKERFSSVDKEMDYIGMMIPDKFVVGYGCDYNGHFRNMPAIATINKDKLNLIK